MTWSTVDSIRDRSTARRKNVLKPAWLVGDDART